MKMKLTALLVAIMATASASFAVDTVACAIPAPVSEAYVTRSVPVQQVIQVPRQRMVTERVMVPATRTVYENVPYTVNETRYQTVQETRMRTVNRTVREYETRKVARTVYDRVCDDCGRSRRVARTEYSTVNVPVRRRVCAQEPYAVNVRVPVSVPVTRYRKVARTVATQREVRQTRYVTEMVPQTVTTMRQVVEACPVPAPVVRPTGVCTIAPSNAPIAGTAFANM